MEGVPNEQLDLEVRRNIREWRDQEGEKQTRFIYEFYLGDGTYGEKTVNPETRNMVLDRFWNIREEIDGSTSRLNSLKNRGKSLVRTFFPTNIVEELREAPEGVSLSLRSEDLVIPWELAVIDDFLCMKFAVSRITRSYKGDAPNQEGDQIRICLVGDPKGNLPNARGEIENLQEILEDKVNEFQENYKFENEIVALVGSKATKETVLFDILYNEKADWDILHLATHARGLTGSDEPLRLELTEHELTVTDFEGMAVRPLVFLNACGSGSESKEARQALRDRIAKEAGPTLLEKGARGFVGTLWEVPDKNASKFAEEFYRSLVDGSSFGEAARQARHHLQEHRAGSTHLSYVLYGNPDQKLKLFAPETRAGEHINLEGIRKVIELEKEYSETELLLVNELPWILWSESDFLEWVRKMPLSTNKREKCMEELTDYRENFREKTLQGERHFIGITSLPMLKEYLKDIPQRRAESILADVKKFAEREAFQFLLYDPPHNPKIEELELVSKDFLPPEDGSKTLYVFNKQPRLEESKVSYYLYRMANPDLIRNYYEKFQDYYQKTLDQNGIDASNGSNSWVAPSKRVNQETISQLEELIQNKEK